MNEQEKKYVRQSAKLLSELDNISAHFSNETAKQVRQCLEQHRKTIRAAHQQKNRPEPTEWR